MKHHFVNTPSLAQYQDLTLPELSDIMDGLCAIQKSEKRTKATDKEISVVRLAIQQRQRIIKARVMEFEQTNNHHLVFFESTNGFVKIAGHSAIFFVNAIANRIHWRYVLNSDTDRYSISEDGVISFRAFDQLRLRLAEISVFIDEAMSDNELHFFTLPKTYTDEQISKLRDQTQDDIKQIMNIVMPASPIPSLYDAIMQASHAIYYQFKHLSDSLAKDTVGERMIMLTYEMAEEYSFYAHAKTRDGALHLRNIVLLSRKLHYGLAYASKLQILHHREARRALEALVAAERIARHAYSKCQSSSYPKPQESKPETRPSTPQQTAESNSPKQPASKSESKPEPKSDATESEPKANVPQPELKSDASKSTPKANPSKPESKSSASKSESKSSASKSESKSNPAKSESNPSAT